MYVFLCTRLDTRGTRIGRRCTLAVLSVEGAGRWIGWRLGRVLVGEKRGKQGGVLGECN